MKRPTDIGDWDVPAAVTEHELICLANTSINARHRRMGYQLMLRTWGICFPAQLRLIKTSAVGIPVRLRPWGVCLTTQLRLIKTSAVGIPVRLRPCPSMFDGATAL